MKKKRMIFTGHPSNCGIVRDNPGQVVCVIGPFESFSADDDLVEALEQVVKKWNAGGKIAGWEFRK